MENYLISSSMIGIMAQRLVRVICPECKEVYTPEIGVMEELGVNQSEASKLTILKEPDVKSAPTRDSGDEGVSWTLLVNDDIRELILAKAPSNVIQDKGRSHGMPRPCGRSGVE